MSGLDLDGISYRKGSVDAIRHYVNGKLPEAVERDVRGISEIGATPLVVATHEKVLGTIQLKDIVKGGLADRFERFRAMGIRTVMITGDNPLTAAAIAKEAGVDDFGGSQAGAKACPHPQRAEAGHLVAMTGDGTNDAPARPG